MINKTLASCCMFYAWHKTVLGPTVNDWPQVEDLSLEMNFLVFWLDDERSVL